MCVKFPLSKILQDEVRGDRQAQEEVWSIQNVATSHTCSHKPGRTYFCRPPCNYGGTKTGAARRHAQNSIYRHGRRLQAFIEMVFFC